MKYNYIPRTMPAASGITIFWLLVVMLFSNELVSNENKRHEKEAEMLYYYTIQAPTGIAVDSVRERIIVSDIGEYGYLMNSVKKSDAKKPGLLSSHREGFLYTTERHPVPNRVNPFPLGKYALLDSLVAPRGITIHQDTLYIADEREIVAMNLIDTTIVFKYEFNIADYSPFLYDAIGDSSGNVYISDYLNNRMFRLNVLTREVSEITQIGAELNNPSAMFFEKENNRIIYGTANNPDDKAKLMALDLNRDSCYLIMEFNFRNIAGITRDRHGDFFLSQGNEKNNGYSEKPWYGSYIYKMKGDFSEQPKIISVKNDDIFGMAKFIPETDTLLFTGIRSQETWMYREDLSHVVAKPELLIPTPERDSLAYNCTFSWKCNRDSLDYYSILELFRTYDTSSGRIFKARCEELSDGISYYSYDDLDLASQYKWVVRGLLKDSGLLYAGTSDTSSFSTYHYDDIPVVDLVYPIDSSIKVPLKFDLTWNAFPGANRYYLEYVESIEDSYEYHFLTSTDTTYTIFPAIGSARYFWRVHVKDYNLSTGWSEWAYFKTVEKTGFLDSCKEIYPPAYNYAVGIPTISQFRWHSVPGATGYMMFCDYKFRYFDNPNDTSTTIHLDTNKLYNWYVVAYNDSSYSEFNHYYEQFSNMFFTGDSIIQAPKLFVAKRFHDDPLRPTLYWNNTGASMYVVHVTKDYGKEFGKGKLQNQILQGQSDHWDWDDLIFEELVYTNSFKFPENLEPNAIYRWCVTARIQDEEIEHYFNLSEMSKPQKFKLEDIEVGVDDSIENGLIIYPNPASHLINIQYDAIGLSTVEIYNTYGNKVASHKLNGNEATLDVSDLAAGLYLVKIISRTKQYQGYFSIIK